MSESSELIVHAVYKHNLDRKDENGNQVYVPVYFENAIEDVRLSPFDEIADLDNIPKINYEEDDLMKYLQVREAVIRKLDNAKINKTEATTVATPNKLLYLDNAGILQATAKNAQQLGGVDASKYARLTDIQGAEWTLEDVYVLGFEPIANLDAIPSVNYDSDSLMQFLKVYEAHIRKLERDKVNKSDTVTTAAPNKLLYLDGDAKLQATVKNAEQLGGVAAANYLLKSAAVTSAQPNKILYLDANSKLQATANNADKLGGLAASDYMLKNDATNTATAGKLLYLDANAKLQATVKNAEQLGGVAAANYLLKSAAVTSAQPNKILYLDSDSKLQATANNADKLGGIEASKYLLIADAPTDLGEFTNNKGYALKTDIPAVWNSSGHLVSPAGWKIYITD